MDDWKLKTRPVVRLKRSKKTFVYLTVNHVHQDLQIVVYRRLCFLTYCRH